MKKIQRQNNEVSNSDSSNLYDLTLMPVCFIFPYFLLTIIDLFFFVKFCDTLEYLNLMIDSIKDHWGQ